MIDLRKQRVLIVGGSSGIGRSLGQQCADAGARVAFAARRSELVAEAAAEGGARCLGLSGDVRDPEDCRRFIEESAVMFGGLDVVVYAAGLSPLTRFVDAGPETWRTVLETNVLGAAMVSRAAIPHLAASKGRLVVLGSSSVGRPYPGLVPYITSKAALHEMARGLRNEYPELSVTTFVVGPTITGFADSWNAELSAAMFTRWSVEGYPAGSAMTAADAALQILHVLASGARIDEVHVMPDPPTPAG